MWTLIILHVLAGSATANNSQPILYSGFTFEKMESKYACEKRKELLTSMNEKRNNGPLTERIRDGVIEMRCEKD